VLEKDREDHLDRTCEKRITKSEKGKKILHTIKRNKEKLIGLFLRRNYFLNTFWKE
jgi:hypothetical protein